MPVCPTKPVRHRGRPDSGFGEGGFLAPRMGCETVAGRHPQAAGLEQARSRGERRLSNSMSGGCGSARRLIHRSWEAKAGPVGGDLREGFGDRAIPTLEEALPAAVRIVPKGEIHR